MWISCKEKLPVQAGIYLVCYEEEINGEKDLRTSYLSWQEFTKKSSDKKKPGWLSRGEISRDKIRFWMPLPEPPLAKKTVCY